MEAPQNQPSVDDNSLDKQDTVVSSDAASSKADEKNKKALKGSFLSQLIKRLSFLNVYLLLFVLIILI